MSAIINRIGERARFHRLAGIVCALFLITGITIIDDYGASGDDGLQRKLAENTLNYVLDDDQALLQAHDRFYGAAFELLPLFVERALDLEDSRDIYLSRHILIHLLFLVGGVFCYLLAWRLSGDRLIALLIMLLFLLSPRLYAHSFFNSKDPPFLSAFVIALYFAHRAFRRDTTGAFLLCGAVVGLLTSLRIMGAALFAIVLAFRVWDFFLAGGGEGGWRERRRVLSTIYAFALAGLFALAICLPYVWEDPFRLWSMPEDLPEIYNLMPTLQLFRGELFLGANLPWDYLPHWYAITTPPVTLLLGLLGIGALGLAAWGIFRGGLNLAAGLVAALDRDLLRFGWLLIACLALPLIAVILMRPNIHDGWRYFFFLHAPFCLLATFALMGLRQLSVRGLGKGLIGGVACALTAAGLGIVVVQMAQLHPNQHLYFNVLTERHIPGRLKTQYETDYENMMLRQGYEHILERVPHQTALLLNMRKRGSPMFEDAINPNIELLPAADRNRFTHDPSRDPDFYLSGNSHRKSLPKDPFPPVLHRIEVYNNAIMTVSMPDLAWVDPAVADEYRALYRTATAGQSVGSAGGFDAYLHGGRLAWVKEACEPGELMPPFWLKLYPADAERLPNHRQVWGYIELDAHGVRFDGKCLGARRLPIFALSRIRLGQSAPGGELLWETDIRF